MLGRLLKAEELRFRKPRHVGDASIKEGGVSIPPELLTGLGVSCASALASSQFAQAMDKNRPSLARWCVRKKRSSR